MNDIVWKPSWADTVSEAVLYPHTPEELADCFTAHDGGSTEYEVLNWLHATIRAIKPKYVLETGGLKGIGTVAMAHACKLNGFGKVICLENNHNCCAEIEESLEKSRLSNWAEVHYTFSTDFLLMYNYEYDLAFFDSDIEVRAIECSILLKRGLLKKIGVFHDTSEGKSGDLELQEKQAKYREELFKLAKHPACSGYYDSKLSRGFMALFFSK